ncbi:NDP-hexose 2,3-dehydratase family protein [Streptomyces sp. NPDC057638]|uniref:NDP-hexose 2,3-dehydratase family protein n=1 Tax=Streptomyces sp. NPDC057638 TaxID=3346190 RepID=UPI00368B9B88
MSSGEAVPGGPARSRPARTRHATVPGPARRAPGGPDRARCCPPYPLTSYLLAIPSYIRTNPRRRCAIVTAEAHQGTGTVQRVPGGGGFSAWWDERRRGSRLSVTPLPFADLDQWRFTAEGDLAHDSGRFFTVTGLRSYEGGNQLRDQPVISQPEIGVLGVLLREYDGEPHVLLQAKAEPGNINGLQLSPTVQATRSNYTRVHRGAATRHLEHFTGARPGRVLVDSLQSEQGAWFWQKQNRNMVVEAVGEVEEHPDFHWVGFGELRELLRQDHLINMDTRSVLGCLPLFAPAGARRESGTPRHTMRSVLSWLIDVKARSPWHTRLIPLRAVEGWSRTETEISDEDGHGFRIVAAGIETRDREVRRWSQPLLAPRGHGLAAFLVRRIDGVRHLLVQARAEPGLRDLIELAPTVQRSGMAGAAALGGTGPFEPEALTDSPGRVLYDARLSEEGGRFHHAVTRYRIVDLGADFPLDVPENYRWLTANQLRELVRHGHYVNVEARSLLACLATLG